RRTRAKPACHGAGAARSAIRSVARDLRGLAGGLSRRLARNPDGGARAAVAADRWPDRRVGQGHDEEAMNAAISGGAFALGLAVVAWVGAGYLGSSPFALAITVLIGIVHLAGGAELLGFRRDTRALEGALGRPPTDDALDEWLARLPTSLRQA